MGERIFEYWKDVPWKGNVLVRINPTTVKEDISRYFEVLGKTSKQATFVDKFVHVPKIAFDNILTRTFGITHYQDYTHTVTLYNKNFYAGMHEMGHALDYDTNVANLKDSHEYIKMPQQKGFASRLKREWRASSNAMKYLRTDDERREAMKVLEPAYGTYVGDALGKAASVALIVGAAGVIVLNPALAPAHLFAYALAAKTGFVAFEAQNIYASFSVATKAIIDGLFALDIYATARDVSYFTGIIGAKIASALKSRRSSFGYVFNDVPEKNNNVMFVGSASPALA
jgi:hypothetical protein